MNRPKLIRIHRIKGLKGLREDTLRPFLSALRPCIPAPLRSFLCSEILFFACWSLLFAGS